MDNENKEHEYRVTIYDDSFSIYNNTGYFCYFENLEDAERFAADNGGILEEV